MNDEVLTPWINGASKPVRLGVYMQLCGAHGLTGYQYWDGELWHAWSRTINGANLHRDTPPAVKEHQNDNWRGLKTVNGGTHRLAQAL